MEPTLPDEFRTTTLKTGRITVTGPSTTWRAPGRAQCTTRAGWRRLRCRARRVSYAPSSRGPKFPLRTHRRGGRRAASPRWDGAGVTGGAAGTGSAQEKADRVLLRSEPARVGKNTTTVRSPMATSGTSTFRPVMCASTFPAGSAWRRNPVPACNWTRATTAPPRPGPRPAADEEEDEGANTPETGYQFTPPWPAGSGTGARARTTAEIASSSVGQLRVPDQKGEYVLSWRWDCENSPQIWEIAQISQLNDPSLSIFVENKMRSAKAALDE